MQKFVNVKEKMVDESIEGFANCYGNAVTVLDYKRALKYTPGPVPGKVGIVAGGGWGHDPAFMGYLGKNMLDAVAIGNTFSPPEPEAFEAAFRAADSGKGVACLYGNFPMDIANASFAATMVANEGIVVKTVMANDDVAETDPAKRRGATGEVLLWKIGGAAAALGYDLDGVIRVCQRAANQTRSIAVGLASCIIPETGRPNYLIERGTMEVGVSHHGLISKETVKLRSAQETAEMMMSMVTHDGVFSAGDNVLVMISGLGNTMLSELYILSKHISGILKDKGIAIHRTMAGNYFTSLDMMGAALTVLKLDDELKALIDYPAYPVAFNHFCTGEPT